MLAILERLLLCVRLVLVDVRTIDADDADDHAERASVWFKDKGDLPHRIDVADPVAFVFGRVLLDVFRAVLADYSGMTA